MRFGTFHHHAIPPWMTAHEVVQNQWGQILASEAAGFDTVWLAEHNARDFAMLGNVTALATAVAAVTHRVRIATGVVRLPLHHPVHVAEDLAYADVLSGGRITFGVGKGYDPLEFGAYGVSSEERDERWLEGFEAVRQMWRTGSTEFRGKYFDCGPGKLLPPPVQEEIPAIVMVSGSDASLAIAADRLLPVAFSSVLVPEQLRERRARYVELATQAGHPDDQIQARLDEFWQLKPVFVADSRQQAVDAFTPGMEYYINALEARANPFGDGMFGSPDELSELFADYAEQSGISNFICWMSLGGTQNADVLKAFELFSEHIIPQLSEHNPSAAPA